MSYLIVGDLHFGAKKNSEKFNQQILEFIDWMIEFARKNNVDTIIQEGDWFESRNSINVLTLNYGIEGAKRISEFVGRENLYIIQGNHDLFYLSRNDVCSIRSLEHYAQIVDEVQMVELCGEEVVLTPWITSEDQWNKVKKLGKKGRMAIGHFELNDFNVTGSHTMNHGYNRSDLKKYDYVFSGHYHTRQIKDNVIYTGTPYPITMNEANQEHGIYLVSDDSIDFIEYSGIKVLSVKYEDLEESIKDMEDFKNTTIRVEFPSDVDPNKITETVDVLNEKGFDGVKTKYQPPSVAQIIQEADEIEVERVEDIDQVIYDLLSKDEKTFQFDRKMMLEIYKEATENS